MQTPQGSRQASNLDQSAQTEVGCIQTWSDGSVYKGLFKDGRRHGHGEERWPNGEVSFVSLFLVFPRMQISAF